MALKKTNWVTLTVAFCFVILQALQPFIHAHLDASHPIQNTGFHVGTDHEEAVHLEPVQTEASLHAVPHSQHTISVESGIKQDVDSLLIPNIVALIVISIFLVMSLRLTTEQYSYLSFTPYQSLKRRLPASRAPPQY